jgi:hypothetical protein
VSGGRRDTPRTVLDKTFALLDCFSSEQPALRLTDLGRSTGLPLSTVLRLATELCEWGVLERRPDRLYRMGPQIQRWADAAEVTASPGRSERMKPPAPQALQKGMLRGAEHPTGHAAGVRDRVQTPAFVGRLLP